jgi:clan AA aspartic protease (TIGR02281 family)
MEKDPVPTSRQLIARYALLALCGIAPLACHADDCGTDRFFSFADAANASPLKKPSAEFANLRHKAGAGSAAAQRSLAVLYETGYLVSPCAEKALHWYRLAGKNGDRIAQDWMENHTRLERMRAGPECLGGYCDPVSSQGLASLALIADPDSHFYAPVSINGVAVRGVVDTGATAISMSAATAQRMHISYLNGRRTTLMTANGSKEGYVVTVDAVTVGSITLHDVSVTVSDPDMPLLIGMSFLRRVNVDMRGNSMTLSKR